MILCGQRRNRDKFCRLKYEEYYIYPFLMVLSSSHLRHGGDPLPLNSKARPGQQLVLEVSNVVLRTGVAAVPRGNDQTNGTKALR